MNSKHDDVIQIANIAEQKRQLRRTCRKLRMELGETERQQASQAICNWIEAWSVFQVSEVILAYMPITGEVDVSSLMERHPQKRWALPRIMTEEVHHLIFHPFQPGKLIRHPFGMEEPAPDLPVIPPSEIQLALVPGVAFDREGWRLGYGGGYFDRFLHEFSGNSLGITFQAVLLDQLPHGKHDVPVEWIVTETGILGPMKRLDRFK